MLEELPIVYGSILKKIQKDCCSTDLTGLVLRIQVAGSLVSSDRGRFPARFPTPDRSKWLHRRAGELMRPERVCRVRPRVSGSEECWQIR